MRPGLILAAMLLAARSASAQAEIDPSLFVDALRESYRAAPFAERVVIGVRRPRRPQPDVGEPADADAGGEWIRRSIVVRVEPFPPEQDAIGVRSLRLDLGDLRIHAHAPDGGPGRLVAENVGDPTRAFVAEFHEPLTAATLARMLPPIPLPHVALASAGAPSDLFEYATDIRWRSLSRSPREITRPASLDLATLIGDAREGPVTLTCAFSTPRLRSLTIEPGHAGAEGGGGGGGRSLELSCRAIEAGDPRDWAIGVDARERVASIRSLRPSPGPVLEGQPLPDLRVRARLGDDAVSLWSTLDALRAGHPDEGAAMILVRVPGDRGVADAIAADAEAGLRAILAARGPEPRDLEARAPRVVLVLGVFDLIAASPERVGAFLDAWRGRAGVSGVAWHESVAVTLGRLAPERDSCIVLLGPDRTLVRVLVLDGRADDASLADEVAHALPGTDEGP